MRQFLEKLIETVPYPVRDMCVIADNHSAHLSYYVRDYLAFAQLQIVFQPPYSSPLNCCETVWSIFKKEFAKNISKITRQYDMARFDEEVGLVIDQVGARLRPTILGANRKALIKID